MGPRHRLNGIINYAAGQKEKLSEVEIQAKKAEAAQRRKMQVEKAEKEQQVSTDFIISLWFLGWTTQFYNFQWYLQAEAMRKILGIDSEKKKEEKKQKEREEKV